MCVTILWRRFSMLKISKLKIVYDNREYVYLDLTRPWLKEGLFCSAEPQDPEPLRSSSAEKDILLRLTGGGTSKLIWVTDKGIKAVCTNAVKTVSNPWMRVHYYYSTCHCRYVETPWCWNNIEGTCHHVLLWTSNVVKWPQWACTSQERASLLIKHAAVACKKQCNVKHFRKKL